MLINTGNELADYLAKEGNQLSEEEGLATPIPFQYVKNQVEEIYLKKWQHRWRNSKRYVQTRALFPDVNFGKLKLLLRLPKSQITMLVQAGTGHGLYAQHVAHWKDIEPDCHFCLEEEETPTHLLHECPALWRERMEWQTCVERSSSPVALERQIIRFFSTNDMMALYQLNS